MRIPVDKRIRIAWTDAQGVNQMLIARCVDISQTGLKILAERPIPTGSYLNFILEPDGFRGSGSVRFCRPKGLKAAIGIEFSGGLTWNPDRSGS